MIKKRILQIFALCVMLLMTTLNVQASAPTNTWNITINGPDDLKGCDYDDSGWLYGEQCFTDPTLRGIVYDALKEFYTDDAVLNNPNLVFTNTTMRQILYDFRGDINAKGKGITSIRGVKYLIHAGTVDLRANKISDFTELNPGSTVYNNDHYGYGAGMDPDSMEARNVTWKLGGNPFRKLPIGLGGRLVVEATQTTSSNYDEDEQPIFKVHRDNTEKFSGVLSIDKCEIMDGEYVENGDGSGTYQPRLNADGTIAYRKANITTINFVKAMTDDNQGHLGDIEDTSGVKLDLTKGDIDRLGNHIGYNDTMLWFTDLQTSRRQRIGIGADQEIHYASTDEFGTITPGSQSFKYYIDPFFYVYDDVDVLVNGHGQVELTKVDAVTKKPLGGAVYALYQGNQKIKENITTDKNGKIKIADLPSGNYTLKETQAPDGYDLSTKEVSFTIEEIADVVIGGGTNTFTTTEDTPKTFTAKDDHQTFIAGPLDAPITLTQVGNGQIEKIDVTYARVNDGTNVQEQVTSTFTNLQDAEAQLNDRKQKGFIYGGVTINVTFKTDSSRIVKLNHVNSQTPTKPDQPDEPNVPNKPNEPNHPKPDSPSPSETKPNDSIIKNTGANDSSLLFLSIIMLAFSFSIYRKKEIE